MACSCSIQTVDLIEFQNPYDKPGILFLQCARLSGAGRTGPCCSPEGGFTGVGDLRGCRLGFPHLLTLLRLAAGSGVPHSALPCPGLQAAGPAPPVSPLPWVSALGLHGNRLRKHQTHCSIIPNPPKGQMGMHLPHGQAEQNRVQPATA